MEQEISTGIKTVTAAQTPVETVTAATQTPETVTPVQTEGTPVTAQRSTQEAEEVITGTPGGTNYTRKGLCAYQKAGGDQGRRRGPESG